MIFLLFLLLVSCERPSPPVQHFDGNAMTIDYHITIAGDVKRREVHQLIQATFDEVDQVFNKWNPDSELSKLNKLPAHKKVAISPELEQLFELCDEIHMLSKGLFDPTIEPMQQLWKKHLTKQALPSEEKIQKLAPAIGWKNIHVENHLFWKDHTATQIDLGAIAKGHCVDLLTERLNAAGYPNLLVDWGGEIRATGQHPELRPWTIFISKMGDTNPDHAVDIITLENQAIATSGDYNQYWDIQTKEGKRYAFTHILDPKLLRPLRMTSKAPASASVRASNCALADGLATVLLLHPNGNKWMQSLPYEELSWWIVTR